MTVEFRPGRFAPAGFRFPGATTVRGPVRAVPFVGALLLAVALSGCSTSAMEAASTAATEAQAAASAAAVGVLVLTHHEQDRSPTTVTVTTLGDAAGDVLDSERTVAELEVPASFLRQRAEVLRAMRAASDALSAASAAVRDGDDLEPVLTTLEQTKTELRAVARRMDPGP